jgi:protein-tyrosine phosphatase
VTRRLLVVCTANICRSPVAERLLTRALADRRDVDGVDWAVTSAGTGQYDAVVDPNTLSAAADVGIDVGTHRARRITRGILDDDGADLVLTMTRSHLPTVVALDPAAWSRTFTLKELARRASTLEPPTTTEGFSGWRARMAAGRQARELLDPDPADDVADPHGMPRRHHVAMVAEVAHEIDRLVTNGPWSVVRADVG